MRYAAIADWAAEEQYPVTFMCDQLGVVRQGYYWWLANGLRQREHTDAQLTETIREISPSTWNSSALSPPPDTPGRRSPKRTARHSPGGAPTGPPRR